jgi:hypothetical protein
MRDASPHREDQRAGTVEARDPRLPLIPSEANSSGIKNSMRFCVGKSCATATRV